ncbi:MULTISPECIES: hypothetical protein [unclassified Streptomyces]|uniref:hypothetical protein n=1 Tax=unclassified Streptomyces TaxID=2593676 RepID=UPI0036608711
MPVAPRPDSCPPGGRGRAGTWAKGTLVSDWKEGTKYLQYVTGTPSLELGEADGSPATAWWFSTSEDASERRPFQQIVSHAVGEYQNIGDHCVWLDINPYPTAEDRGAPATSSATSWTTCPRP